MPKPWEKYAKSASAKAGPWEKYAAAPSPATVTEPTETPEPKAQTPFGNSAPARLLSSAYSGFGIGPSTQENPSEFITGPATAIAHPSALVDSLKEMGKGVWKGMQDTNDRAHKELSAPGIDSKISGGIHWLESGVPVIGPMLAQSGDQISNGDIAGGLGTAMAVAAPVVAAGTIAPRYQTPAAPSPKAPVPAQMGKVAPISSVPVDNSLRLSRFMVRGNPTQLLTRGLKPGVAVPEFESAITRRLPEIINTAKDQNVPLTSVKSFGQITDAATEGRSMEYQNLIAPFREPAAEINGQSVRAEGPYRPAPINTTPIADAGVRSIPISDLIEKPNRQTYIQRGNRGVNEGDPGIVAKTEDKMSPYRTQMPIGTVDAVRVDKNAKLNSFYAKNGGDQFAALSDPETARTKAIRDTAADLVYDRLEKETGVNPRPIQDAYGDLTEIGNVANKRGIVFGRQNPVSLSQEIVTGHGGPMDRASNFFINRAIRGATDSDALVRLAVDRQSRGTQVPASPPSIAPPPGWTNNNLIYPAITAVKNPRKNDGDQ